MAPADTLAAAGSSTYSSDTIDVGDGTWDYTKNTFLLPNLEGLNFATMRYNGMGNRFSTIPQYHSLVTGHAIMGAITFLLIIPVSVMIARFHRSRSGFALRYHTYLNVVAAMFSTVVLILGWFAVGPHRSLSNPHHGIGIAIYTLIMVQTVGGRLVRHLAGRHSLRLDLHRWSGRAIALLGIVQVPLGLTLYGSPKVLFILYSIWMAFLLLVYFVLSHRQGSHHNDSRHSSGRSEGRKSTIGGGTSTGGGGGGGMMRWVAPLAAGAGAWALLRGRKKDRSRSRSHRGESRSRVDSRSRVGSRSRAGSRSRVDSRSRSRSRSRSGSRSYSRSRATDMVSSRRGSESFVEDEKYRGKKQTGGGGFMSKMMAAGAAAGAGALLSNLLSKRKERNRDEEYSAVDTDTPSRHGRSSQIQRPAPRRQPIPQSEVSSYFTEDDSRLPDRTASPTPAPRRGPSVGRAAVAGAAAGTAAAAVSSSRRNNNSGSNGSNGNNNGNDGRPMTPRPSHQRQQSAQDNGDVSDYSSYQSPSQRTPPASRRGNTAKAGLFGGMGLGWIANKIRGGRRPPDDNEQMRRDEEDRRSGAQGSRYTGDGYPTSSRRDRDRDRDRRSDISGAGAGGRPPPRMRSLSDLTDSVLEPASSMAPAPLAPGHSTPPRYPVTPGGPSNPRRSGSRHDVEPTVMPAMPADSDVSSVLPTILPQRQRGDEQGRAESSRRGDRDRDRERDRRPPTSGGSSKPVSVRLKVHDDRGGNVTLRRMTDAETAAERSGSQQQFQSQPSQPSQPSQRRRYDDSASSLSEVIDSPSARRYRRESSGMRRAEQSAERRTEQPQQQQPQQSQSRSQSQAQLQSPPQLQLTNPSASSGVSTLDPPNPPFAGGRRPKDSAYYSGGKQRAGGSGGGEGSGGHSGGSGGGSGGGDGGPQSSVAATGPSGGHPAPTAGTATVSSIGSQDSHGTWSAMSPSPRGRRGGAGGSGGRPGSAAGSTLAPDITSSAAAERRRRRRLERNETSRQPSRVDYQ